MVKSRPSTRRKRLKKSKSSRSLSRQASHRRAGTGRMGRSFRRADDLMRLSTALVQHNTQNDQHPDTFFDQLETIQAPALSRTASLSSTASRRSRPKTGVLPRRRKRRSNKILQHDSEHMELMEHVRDLFFDLKSKEEALAKLERCVAKKRRKVESAEHFAQRIVNESMLYCPDNDFLKLVRAEHSCSQGLRDRNRQLSRQIQQHKAQLGEWRSKVAVDKLHAAKLGNMDEAKKMQSLRDGLHVHMRRFGMNQIQEFQIHRELADVDNASWDVVVGLSANEEASHKVDLLQQHIISLMAHKDRNNAETTLLADDLARIAQAVQKQPAGLARKEEVITRASEVEKMVASIQKRQEQRNTMSLRS